MGHKILHLSFDYAEDNIGISTVAVGDLIKETSKLADIKIISLHRSLNPFKEKYKKISDVHILKYNAFGLPFGFFLLNNMKRIYRNVFKLNQQNKISLDDIDVIHSHKLTFEGFIGYLLAVRLKKKLFISLRQTDFFVLKYRKDLISFNKDILKYASTIFYIAPFMKEKLFRLFGEDFFNLYLKNKLVFFPNSLDMDNFIYNQREENGNLLTIVWMKKHVVQRKNMLRLFKAIKLINDENLRLDIIGSGVFEDTVKKWVKDLGIENNVKFLGYIKNENISSYLNSAKAFLMPSKSETFGMAYAEALLCGTPILYSKGTGFDGIFEDVGVGVDPYSVNSISDGIKNLIENNQFYRDTIKRLNDEGAFKIFSKKNVRDIYINRLEMHS